MDILTEITTELENCSSLFEVEQKILQWAMSLAQEAMKSFLEGLDDQLFSIRAEEQRVINRQERTVAFAFGPVTFNRRYYQGQGFALDQELKITPRKRLSAYYSMMIAKVAQVTTMRNTAMIINLIFNSGVTVDSVMKIVHRLGLQVGLDTIEKEKQVQSRRVPTNLTIEGDAFALKLKTSPGHPAGLVDVHHLRVYEQDDNHRFNCHDFLSLGKLESLKDRVKSYLDTHYRLNRQTIFLGSDAGPGYQPESMLDLVPINAHGEYILDRYHSLRKIENSLGRSNPLTHKACQALCDHDLSRLIAVLDTEASLDLSTQQAEALTRLRSYLDRNWDYTTLPKDRGYNAKIRLGSVESSHRAFTYRMKKQGKSWSKVGAEAMLGLIEARLNKTLLESLESLLKQETPVNQALVSAASEKTSMNLRPYLRKSPLKPSCGAHHGRIILNGPSSSPIGYLAHILNA